MHHLRGNAIGPTGGPCPQPQPLERFLQIKGGGGSPRSLPSRKISPPWLSKCELKSPYVICTKFGVGVEYQFRILMPKFTVVGTCSFKNVGLIAPKTQLFRLQPARNPRSSPYLAWWYRRSIFEPLTFLSDQPLNAIENLWENTPTAGKRL